MHTIKRTIRFYDSDPAGVLFFGNLFRYLHAAYEDFLIKNNLKKYFTSEKILLPVIHSEADFHKPLKPFDTVTINVRVSGVKESSYEINYEVYNNREELAAKGRTVHVVVDADFKKIKIPDDLRRLLELHLIQ
ncbi:thioesterase [Melioribacter roseus P3M-2]|uniref:Thioesterase n=1 Tax=Melioribacter roseus (strain DSM 23840 / JCM 17771 / VKM B-2668 / P3M-2) TaxID=1191523 RepID=I7A454_MELRP|nr:thioesterase family protein [Melioribacter roseus]AFN74681.1 thioesterase [Melioribacter roseus P3M-2]